MSGPFRPVARLIAIAITLSVLLAGCGVDRSKLSEDPDFSPQEFSSLVALLVKRFDIPVVKNIGFAELPSMGLTNSRTVWLGAHNLLEFDSFADCGSLCTDLQRNGYVGEFVAGFDQSEASRSARAVLIEKYYGPDVSTEIDYAAITDNQISPNYRSCIIMPFNQVFRIYLCAQAGNFLYAYAIKSANLRQKRELDYANVTGDARFTIEGFVTWYDFYDWLKTNK